MAPTGGGLGTIGPNAKVGALAVFDGGGGPALFAGGGVHAGRRDPERSTSRGGTARSWSPLSGPAGDGVDGEIYDLAVYDDASGPALYATGPFLQAGGIPVERIARWDGTRLVEPARRLRAEDSTPSGSR